MSKYKTLVKDTFIFALGSIGSKAIVFFLVPLYTNVLTKAEYGTADLAFTFSQLMMPIISLAIYNAITRFGLQNKDHPENTVLCGMVVWIVGCAVSILLAPVLGLYKPIAEWKWYLILHVNASIVLTVAQDYLKVKNYNLKYSIISIIQTTLLACLNILLLVVFEMGVAGYLLSNAMASLISAIVAIIAGDVIKDIRHSKFDKNLLSDMIKYSAPLILNNIAWWLIQSSDKVMIEMYVGTAALGLYTVATRIPSLVNVVVSIFQQAWGISSIVEMDSTNDNTFYSSVFNIYTVLVFGASIVVNAIIKPFMRIYVGSDFYEAWTMAPILVVSAAAFSAVAAFYGSMYGALKKSINNMLSTVVAAGVNIVMNYIFIHFIGAMGAVLGTLISYFVLAFIRIIDVNRYIKISVNYYIYSLNCVLVIIDAILITIDFYGYFVSIVTCVIFAIINKTELIMLKDKTLSYIWKRRQ